MWLFSALLLSLFFFLGIVTTGSLQKAALVTAWLSPLVLLPSACMKPSCREAAGPWPPASARS